MKKTSLMFCMALLAIGILMIAGCSGGGYAKTQWYSVHGGYENSLSFQDEKSWNGTIGGEGLSGTWSNDNGKLVLSGGRETLFMSSEEASGQEVLVMQDGSGKNTPFFKSRDAAIEYEKNEVTRILTAQKWYGGEFIADPGEMYLSFVKDGTWSTESTKNAARESIPALVENGASGKFTITSIEQTKALHGGYGVPDFEGAIDFENVGSFAFSITLGSSASEDYDVLRIANKDSQYVSLALRSTAS